MIRQLIVSLTTAGLSAGLIVAASAADLSRPASAPVYTKAPLAPAPYSWTGFYIGADAGYGWGRSTESFADPGNAGFDACGQCEGPWDPQNVKATSNSFLGGLYAGYNWQLVPNWLVGVEGDFTWTHLKNSSATALSQPAPGPGSTTFQSSLNLETTVNWLASARARAGFTQQNWLVYATGGAAWANADFNANANCPIVAGFCGAGFGQNAAASATQTRTGFVVGGGLEWQPTATPWRVRAEYLYYGFNGTDNLSGTWLKSTGGPSPCLSSATCSASFSSGDLTVQTVRVGVSYAFH